MSRDKIGKLLEDAKKALEGEHGSMRDQIRSELAALKKKALSDM